MKRSTIMGLSLADVNPVHGRACAEQSGTRCGDGAGRRPPRREYSASRFRCAHRGRVRFARGSVFDGVLDEQRLSCLDLRKARDNSGAERELLAEEDRAAAVDERVLHLRVL